MPRDLNELSDLEKLSVINMSYSRLDTIDSCEAKYFYSYILEEERTFGPAAALGTTVHSVLESTDLNVLEIDAILARYEQELLVEDPDTLISDELRDVGRVILSEFVDRHDGDIFETIASELEFEMVIGSCLYRGYIDRVDRTTKNGLLITDYKTGKYQVAQKNAHSNLQLGLYAIACHYKYPDLWPIRGELYYLRTGKSVGHTYTADDLVQLEDRILQRSLDLVNTDNFRYTSNERTCLYMCDFGKSGACPRGATVVRRKLNGA